MTDTQSRMTTLEIFRTICVLLLGILLISKTAVAGDGVKGRSSMYFPNTEELKADEMRVTALGTGLPTPLTRAQKSTAWMVELGNGDVFIFDIGTGSMENVFGLRPDFSKMDKFF